MAVQQLSNANDEGAVLGQSSSDKVGFYGLATPIVRPSVTAYTTTTASISTSTNWGYATSTQADAMTVAVAQCVTALRNLGLVG
jgi:hypothetical protein